MIPFVRGRLVLYVVTFEPSDAIEGYPYMVRPQAAGDDGEVYIGLFGCYCETLTEAREPFIARGLHKLPRYADDDAVIVEVWM